MSSFIRTCILTVMVSSSLACDEGSNFESSELRSCDLKAESSGSLRVLDDPHQILIVDGLELQAVIDPATTPMDVSTGVIQAQATIMLLSPLGDSLGEPLGGPLGDPLGEPLKVQVKVVVLPYSLTAE